MNKPPDENGCSESYNWTEIAPNMTRMCLGLSKELRGAMARLLTGDGIQISHGWCEVHAEAEMKRLDEEFKREWEDFKA